MSGGIALETAGGVAGGIAGGFAGGAIGSVFGPVGTIAGRWAGSRLGQWGGRAAGGWLASKMEDANEKAEPDKQADAKNRGDTNDDDDKKDDDKDNKKRDKSPKDECKGKCDKKTDRDRWTKGNKNSGSENAEAHWNKHKSEFPEYKNSDDYIQGAHNFIDNPPADALTNARSNGDVLQYNPSTNTFSSSTSSGTPRTMFRPSSGISYWNAQ